MYSLTSKSFLEIYYAQLRECVAELGITPHLAIITDGEDPASQIYIRQKVKAAERSGIAVSIENIHSCEEYLDTVRRLSVTPEVHGIIVQQPCKYASFESVKATIPIEKDVDGFCTDSPFIACTPLGIMTLLDWYHISVYKKHCVVIGRSEIVGKPLAQLLLEENATVSVCHSKTPIELRNQLLAQADIIFLCTGVPYLITPEDVRNDAVIIDVGITHGEDGKLCGDAGHPEDWANTNVRITPVPGGIGPMTVASLMSNTYEAALKSTEKEN